MSDHKDRSLIGQARDRLTSLSNSIVPQLRPHQAVFPAFDSLPSILGQPQGCLWGFFDKQGQPKDELGTLNLLTPAVVKEAAKEIRIGEHIQLDWPLDQPHHPSFNRKTFEQRVLDRREITKGRVAGFDDELYINTQSGSQWDSLKHFASPETQMYYNGLTHSDARISTTNGLHNVCERGGIVGRGVLVDWLSWHEQTRGTSPSPITRHEIPVSELDDCLRWQGTVVRFGDVLIVRSGYVRWYNNAPAADRQSSAQATQRIGLQNNEATVRWLYDHHFAAVAGDAMAFEAWPPPYKQGWVLHDWLLVQWGTPIGELWDLEKLSKVCQREGRWTFFLTSAPLHVKGGVGSPPGAIAIF